MRGRERKMLGEPRSRSQIAEAQITISYVVYEFFKFACINFVITITLRAIAHMPQIIKTVLNG